MSTYVVSDIHGCFDELMAALELAGFSENDHLFVLGDLIDRGPQIGSCINWLVERNANDENSNVIVETLCVSGNPARDGGTHRGVFYIYNKASPMDLVGADENGDGQPDYIVPVAFWMPFDGGEGLHDVSTRSAWGGDVYTYSGSHGCVNLPYSAAAELWENTEVGTVVVVHD